MYIKFYPQEFFANYFWSLKPGSKIKEDIFVKTYLSHFFTFRDFVKIYKMVGKKRLLQYAKEIKQEERIKKLIGYIDNFYQNDKD